MIERANRSGQNKLQTEKIVHVLCVSHATEPNENTNNAESKVIAY